MEGADPRFYTFFLIMMAALGFSLIFYPLWAVLHKILPARLDGILFRKPFFNQRELINYQFFPLSLVRSLNYSYLIALPALAKRKRFKYLEKNPDVGLLIKAMCIIHVTSAFLGSLAFLGILGFGGFLFAFHT